MLKLGKHVTHVMGVHVRRCPRAAYQPQVLSIGGTEGLENLVNQVSWLMDPSDYTVNSCGSALLLACTSSWNLFFFFCISNLLL